MTDISRERRELRAEGLAFTTREQWGARESYSSDRACDVPARQLFLHVSVTRLTTDHARDMRTIESIGESRFGIGSSYNAAVFPDGRLLEGQPLTRRGAHTINNFERSTCPTHGGSLTAPSWNNNVTARALVLPQMPSDPATNAQITSAARWAAAQIRAGLVVRGARWHGHRCVTAKACPGDPGYRRLGELQALTNRYVADGLPGSEPVPDPQPEPPTPIEDDMFIAKVVGQPTQYLVAGFVKVHIPDTATVAALQECGIRHEGDVSALALNMFATVGVADVGQLFAHTLDHVALVRGDVATARTDVLGALDALTPASPPPA